MKRIITLLLIGMLAFSAFASTTTTLNINATVAKISPTYSLNGYITYGQNHGNGGTSTVNTASTTVTEGNKGTITVEDIRLTKNTDNTKDDNQFIVTVALIQNESRWYDTVNVEFQFSKISYDITANGNQSTLPKGTYETDYPSTVTAVNRGATVALTVGTLNVSTVNTDGKCNLDLKYSVFGYFIKSGITVTTLTATYNIPEWNGDDVDSNGYFPFGNYTGSVKVIISDRT